MISLYVVNVVKLGDLFVVINFYKNLVCSLDKQLYQIFFFKEIRKDRYINFINFIYYIYLQKYLS